MIELTEQEQAAIEPILKAATADFVAWGPPPSRVKWPEWDRLRLVAALGLAEAGERGHNCIEASCHKRSYYETRIAELRAALEAR